jgi:hypothetical protein
MSGMWDVSNTLIRTKKGRVISVIQDTRLPILCRRCFRLRATNGIIERIERKVFIQGPASASGQAGGDCLCMYPMIEALRNGPLPDIDIHDMAAWSSIIEPSESSARDRSRPRGFPDFTRAKRKTRMPSSIVGASG